MEFFRNFVTEYSLIGTKLGRDILDKMKNNNNRNICAKRKIERPLRLHKNRLE